MARDNEILVGRYNRFLQKFLSMKGGPPAPQLASELIATWSLFHGAENRYLEGWDLFSAFTSQPAVAANNGVIRLRNPLGSNTIGVLFKVMVNGIAADQPLMTFTQTSLDLATVVSITNMKIDPRGRISSGFIFSRQATGAAPASDTTFGQFSFPAAGGSGDFIVTDVQELPLLPGMAVNVQTNQVNVAISGVFGWRERSLEDSERF